MSDPIKFNIVPDEVRESVQPNGRARSPLVKALLDGKTLVIDKSERDRIGGNSKTLRNHGYQLRSGLINDTQVVVWAEKLDANGK